MNDGVFHIWFYAVQSLFELEISDRLVSEWKFYPAMMNMCVYWDKY